MAASVSATLVPNDGNPSCLVTVSGLSTVVGAAYVTVQRYQSFDRWNAGSVVEDVRGLSDLEITGDSHQASDYEFSFTGDDWTYTAIIYDDEGNNIAGATYVGTQSVAAYRAVVQSEYDGAATAMISVPTQPAINIPVAMNEFSAWSYGNTVLSNNHVLGQANPVIANDLNFSRSGTFVLIAGDATFAQDLETIRNTIYRPYTFMFRPLYVSSGFRDCYFNIVGNVDVTRVAAVNANEADDSNISETDFIISLPFQEVDRPATFGEGTTIVTWQDVLDANADWSAVNSGHTDWLDVLNTAGS